jgi:diaminopimelate epimerase
VEPLEFAKGHGTGNDFVILPDPENRLTLTAELVSRLCDRRFGIGGDGVLRVVRSAADASLPDIGEWFMDYRNADGSLAEICANGVRVFARYLVEAGLVAEDRLVVGTRSGPVVAVVSDQAVSVTLGHPRVYAESWAEVDGTRLAGVAVDVGNPHLVCTLPPDRELADLDLSSAPLVDRELFPDGVNVELVAGPPGEPVGTGKVRMRVFERGVGETLSCGSGACAVAAAVLRAAGRAGGVVTVDVPGGRLTVSLTGEDCALTGPAVLVASGTVHVDALERI